LEQMRRRCQWNTKGAGDALECGDLRLGRAHKDPGALGTQRQHAGAALLLELAIARPGDAGADRGIGAADGRMSGEGQLMARREDAHAIVARLAREEKRGLREIGPARDALHVVARQLLTIVREYTHHALAPRRALEYKRGLRKIGPARDALHVVARQVLTVEHDRDRVAEERPAGKDIDLLETPHALSYFRMRRRLWCESVKVASPGRSSISSETSSMRGHARNCGLRVTITWSVALYQ